MRQHFPSAGFTLIELLISVTIMALLVGGGAAAFITFNQRQGVQAAGQELKVYLRTAQQKASAGDKPTSCTGRLEGYQLSLPPASGSVSVSAVCSDGTFLTNTYTLSNEVVNTADQAATVVFFSLHGGTSASPNQSFVVGRDSFAYELVVSKGGEIRDLGISVSETPISSQAPASSPSPSVVASPSLAPSQAPSPSPSAAASPSPSSGFQPDPSNSPRPSGGGSGIELPGGNPEI